MYLSRVLSTELNKVARRLVKVRVLGRDDIQKVEQASPFGVDSNPVKDMVAVYSNTGVKGESVIVGYLNRNQLAAVGEYRTFSTDADGAVKFYIHQKNDGTCEIGGAADHMVRYSKLEEAFNRMRTDLNALIQKFNNHTHVETGGTTNKVSLADQADKCNADISPAKIAEIRTL